MTGIKKLKSGRYQARYFAGYDGAGKRNYPSKTFSLYGDAAKWRTARIREKDLGEELETTKITVGEYLDQWLKSKADLRTYTLRNYYGAVNTYIRPYLGGMPLQSLRPQHIEKWQRDMIERELSAATVRVVRVIFGTALKKAVRLRYIHSNPMAATDPPRREKPKTNSFDREEAQKFIAACKGQRWGLSYELALATGLRPEEIHGLRWSSLDLEGTRGVVHVKEVVVRLKGGGWKFEPPKTENSYRSIIFPADLAKQLRAHRTRQLEDRLAAASCWHDHDLVFTSVIGTPPNRSDHGRQFSKILKAAGIEGEFRLYDLRHSFATLSLLAGVDAKTVSEELGHATVAFTLDTYAHVLKEMKERAAVRRERLMRGRK